MRPDANKRRSLLWTLLKQNPIYEAQPVIKKALVVCPVTLISNWRKEFRKWLGNERIGVFVADKTKNNIRDFTMGKSYSVMIIGYEKLRSVQEDLCQGAGIDIVICDEGHRLKTAQNKSSQAIKALNTSRRVILSGTPIQNDLSEFFVMVDFVNPGLLNSYNTFKKEFEGPIVKSRQPEASKEAREKGTARGEELASLTALFIIRRTAEILSKYLPPKSEYILFCRPTSAQVSVYKAILESPVIGAAIRSNDTALQLITFLKKVCNSPSLLGQRSDGEEKEIKDANLRHALQGIDRQIIRSNPVTSSGKMRVLESLLTKLKSSTQEKIVLVSNYTATLDIIQNLLASHDLKYLRLDGSTPQSRRQDMVDTFNRTSSSVYFAFLLSAKSGGVGLNLIGASRLVLFDVDWNPSTDLQAMARIHRDGQKRDVKIYRLLIGGGIDEKIYQRQVTKLGLADSVMDNKSGSASFTQAELRDLFTLDETSRCQTHDLLACDCGGRGLVAPPPLSMISSQQAINKDDDEDSEDDLPLIPAVLVKATKANIQIQERAMKERAIAIANRGKKSGKMAALLQYSHLNTEIFRQGDSGSVTPLKPVRKAISRTSRPGKPRKTKNAELEIDSDSEDLFDFGDEDDNDDDDANIDYGGGARGEEEQKAEAAALIDDDVLLSVLSDPQSRVSYVFTKTSADA
jgi:DNA repair and recombination protein RAD54B